MDDIAVVNSGEELAALEPDTLTVKGSNLVDEDVAALSRLPALTTVYFDGCRKLGDGALAHLGTLPGLRELYISGDGITDDGLAHLAGCPSLRELGLDAPVTGEGFRHLTGLPDLEELHLPACPGMTVDGVRTLATLPSLRKLCFYGVRAMDDSWLTALKGARTLFKLILMNCPGVTDEGVRDLEAALPDCGVDRS